MNTRDANCTELAQTGFLEDGERLYNSHGKHFVVKYNTRRALVNTVMNLRVP
jgi:hypothetical protein